MSKRKSCNRALGMGAVDSRAVQGNIAVNTATAWVAEDLPIVALISARHGNRLGKRVDRDGLPILAGDLADMEPVFGRNCASLKRPRSHGDVSNLDTARTQTHANARGAAQISDEFAMVHGDNAIIRSANLQHDL